MSKERFLSDVRTARTFSDTKFAQSLTWANKEILRLTAALESANQRAEEADMKRASLSFTSKEQVDIFNRVVKKNEYLEAELADKERELEMLRDADALLARAEPIAINKLMADNESLRERLRDNETAINTILRWCHGNIEIPCEVTPFCIQVRDLIEAIPTESPDTTPDICQTCKGEGVIGYTIDGEQPTLDDCPACVIAVPASQAAPTTEGEK